MVLNLDTALLLQHGDQIIAEGLFLLRCSVEQGHIDGVSLRSHYNNSGDSDSGLVS